MRPRHGGLPEFGISGLYITYAAMLGGELLRYFARGSVVGRGEQSPRGGEGAGIGREPPTEWLLQDIRD